MHIVRPEREQDSKKFFWAVASSGDAITHVKGGFYLVPESTIGLLRQQKIRFEEVSALPPSVETPR